MSIAGLGEQRGSQARYLQIAEWLAEQIESGTLTPGTRLASERELSVQYGVNRMTLRQALQVLELRGLLDRRQGAGTYVAEPKIERSADRLFAFSRGIRQRGLTPSARVVLFEQRPADAALARKLGIDERAQIYYCHRLRLANGTPMMLEKSAFPAVLFPGLELHDLAVRSIYEIMAGEYGKTIAQAHQTLEAVDASTYEAELLAIAPGAACMLESRLTLDTAGWPVEYTRNLYRGDRFRFIAEAAPVER